MADTMAARRARQLQARGGELQTAAGSPPALSPVHEQFLAVVYDMIGAAQDLADDTNEIPLPIRAGFVALQHSKGLLMGKLATVPPAKIQEFMRGIEERIRSITSIEL